MALVRAASCRRCHTWDALSERLPGLRRPALVGGLSRHEVGALLARIEAGVTRDVGNAFEWDAEGVGRLLTAGRSHRAGRFATPSIGELEARVRGRGTTGAPTFSVRQAATRSPTSGRCRRWPDQAACSKSHRSSTAWRRSGRRSSESPTTCMTTRKDRGRRCRPFPARSHGTMPRLRRTGRGSYKPG
jgi:hypothetical protein